VFAADLHPGNILVREVDRSGGIAERFALLLKQLSAGLPLPGVREVFRNVVLPPTPQLVFLDTGMIAELSKADQRSVVQFFKVGALKGCAVGARAWRGGGCWCRLCAAARSSPVDTGFCCLVDLSFVACGFNTTCTGW
jgi:hypothetical protein